MVELCSEFRKIAQSGTSVAFHGWMAVDQDLLTQPDNGQIICRKGSMAE